MLVPPSLDQTHDLNGSNTLNPQLLVISYGHSPGAWFDFSHVGKPTIVIRHVFSGSSIAYQISELFNFSLLASATSPALIEYSPLSATLQ
jgi:hypothetical protein